MVAERNPWCIHRTHPHFYAGIFFFTGFSWKHWLSHSGDVRLCYRDIGEARDSRTGHSAHTHKKTSTADWFSERCARWKVGEVPIAELTPANPASTVYIYIRSCAVYHFQITWMPLIPEKQCKAPFGFQRTHLAMGIFLINYVLGWTLVAAPGRTLFFHFNLPFQCGHLFVYREFRR